VRIWRRALGVVALVLVLAATGPRVSAQPGQEDPHAGHQHGAGQEDPHAGPEHGAGQEDPHAGHQHGHGHGQDADGSSHLPIQLYSIQAYFEAPWRDPRAPASVATQAAIVLLLDGALLIWLRRRWWR